MSAGPAAPAVVPGTLQRLADFATLTRPRLNSLTVFAVGAGWWSAAGGVADPAALVGTMAGAALSGGGASALNQVLERDLDARMSRTCDRPLPTGRVAPSEAVAFGVLLIVAGVALLFAAGGTLTASLALLCVGTYVGIYTPLKTRTSLNTLVGTVPGALPPLMGAAAATDTLGPGAWFLFALVTAWQLPHFLAIAWMWRDDYERAGFAMLPVVTRGDATTGRQVVVQCLLVVAVSLVATPAGLAGRLYFVAALVCGIGFMAAAVRFALRRTDGSARTLMRASIIYLPLVLAAFALDRLPA